MGLIVFLIVDVLLGWGIYGDSFIDLITFQGSEFHATTAQSITHGILSLVALGVILNIYKDDKPENKDKSSDSKPT